MCGCGITKTKNCTCRCHMGAKEINHKGVNTDGQSK